MESVVVDPHGESAQWFSSKYGECELVARCLFLRTRGLVEGHHLRGTDLWNEGSKVRAGQCKRRCGAVTSGPAFERAWRQAGSKKRRCGYSDVEHRTNSDYGGSKGHRRLHLNRPSLGRIGDHRKSGSVRRQQRRGSAWHNPERMPKNQTSTKV